MDDLHWLTAPDQTLLLNYNLLEESNDNFLDSIRYGKEFDDVELKVDPEEEEEEQQSSEEDQYVVIDDEQFFNEFTVVENGGQTQTQGQQTLKIIRSKNSYIITTNNDDEILMEEESSSSSGSDKFFDDSGSNGDKYQELKLSEEEKRLLSKEGINLPSHYPLTKFEERELKRIRRKIRNKISAQDSRKRKKEFLDKLQQRVQEVEEEKSHLSKKVRTLETTNAKLSAQVKRLQQALNQHQKPTATTSTTTLLVLILSLALVVLPTTFKRENTLPSNSEFNQSMGENQKDVGVVARSRTMLPPLTLPNDIFSAKRKRYDDDTDDEMFLRRKRLLFQNTFHNNKEEILLRRIIDEKVFD